jgi:hypothetical protein
MIASSVYNAPPFLWGGIAAALAGGAVLGWAIRGTVREIAAVRRKYEGMLETERGEKREQEPC